MITKRDFIGVLTSKTFDHCTIQAVGSNTISFVDKVVCSNKNYIYFQGATGKSVIDNPFKLKDVVNIYRIAPRNDNDYTYMVQLTDCRSFIIKITMVKGFTPYIRSATKAMNYKSVIDAIPGYFDSIQGKDILVNKAYYSKVFSYYDEKNDVDTHLVTTKFVIRDCKCALEVKNKIPCIKIVSITEANVYINIPNVCMICDTSDSIRISCENGDYYLSAI